MTAPINNWVSRDDIYHQMRKYPNALGITKLSQGTSYWIITKEENDYFLIGSNSKINISADASGKKAMTALDAQIHNQKPDATRFIWNMSSPDLRVIT